MKKSTLLLVKANAQLLISRIDTFLALDEKYFTWSGSYPKEKANIKRTSMELTRSLADLRQNR